jgi:lysophospholipase L1-like esterase
LTGSNIARWFSLFALMALIFFGLGEILTRALNLVDRANGFPRSLFMSADDPGLSYQMRPGVRGRVRGVEVRTNQLGFRGPEINAEPLTGTHRVVILGDSVTFGFRMPEEEIFPSLMARQLDQTRAGNPSAASQASGQPEPKWEILNFGVEGYNTQAELQVLRTTGLRVDPQTVVLVVNLNDYDATPGVGPRGVLTLNRGEAVSPWSPMHVSEFYLLLQWLWRTGGSVWFGAPASDPPTDTEPREFKPLDIYVSALRKEYWRHPTDGRMNEMLTAMRQLARITDAHGIRLLVVILPDGDQIGPAEPDLSPQKRLAAFCQQEDLECLDLYPIFAASPVPNLFMDIMHPNAAGHQLISAAIVERLTGVPEGAP